jgi:hypothetical protein
VTTRCTRDGQPEYGMLNVYLVGGGGGDCRVVVKEIMLKLSRDYVTIDGFWIDY